MNPIVQAILSWVLPIELGPLVYFAARELLNVSRRIDDLPPLVKRLVVGVLGVLLTSAFTALGVALPPECVELFRVDAVSEACRTALSAPDVLRGVTAALVAIAMHALKKSRPNT